MMVITGATGQLGRRVIKHLLQTQPASKIVAAVRDPDKAADLAALGIEVRVANYNQPETLQSAFKGADKLLFISSSEVGQRVKQHTAVIDAAKAADVGLILYTSILHADTSPLPLAAEHQATELLLANSAVSFVLLRNGWYSENYTTGLAGALEHGVILGCAENGRLSLAARDDYAAAAAALLQKEDQAGLIYELAGDNGYTLSELAAEVSRQTGQEIIYQNLPESDYKAALLSVNLPDGLATLLSESDTGAAKGGLFDEGLQLSQLLGRPTTSLQESIKAALAL